MQKDFEYSFAGSAIKEAPLVAGYIAALIIFASAWSHFNLPNVSITEFKHNNVTAQRVEIAEEMGI